jgi:hypothetical protein
MDILLTVFSQDHIFQKFIFQFSCISSTDLSHYYAPTETASCKLLLFGSIGAGQDCVF